MADAPERPTAPLSGGEVAEAVSRLQAASSAQPTSLIVCWVRCYCCRTTILLDNGIESELCAKCQRDYEYELPCWSREPEIEEAFERGVSEAIPAYHQLEGYLEKNTAELAVLASMAFDRELLIKEVERLLNNAARPTGYLASLLLEIKQREVLAIGVYNDMMDRAEAEYPEGPKLPRLFEKGQFRGRAAQAQEQARNEEAGNEESQQAGNQGQDEQERPPYAREAGESSLYRGGHDL